MMKGWTEHCDRAFLQVLREEIDANGNARWKRIGSFKFLPVAKRGVEALEKGQATGTTLRPEDLCSKANRAAAYYIGDVMADGINTRNRAAVVESLLHECERYIKRDVWFYARPITPEGLALMRRRGFRRCSDLSAKFNLEDLCKRNAKASD